MKILKFCFCILLSFQSFAQLSTSIRLNQVGFYTLGPKMAAVVGTTATSFSIKSIDRISIFYEGNLSVASTWNLSGESVKIADFSSFAEPGTYVLDVPTLGYSYTFKIEDFVNSSLNKALIKAYYFNRSSTDLPAKYAGKWARAAGHPDDQVIILPSAASNLRPAGTILSSPKGWYDAGDYNSYIVNSGISTYTLLLSYEQFRNYYDTLNLNIPESGNQVPDILDEIKWNLDWMLTMQDPNDGGVYTKKTNSNFDPMDVMPEDAINARYFCKKSTAATADFSAVLAKASILYKEFDAAFSDKCLLAAQKAYDWVKLNPTITFNNPGASGTYPAVSTGGYGDNDLTDEIEWAGNELYIATKIDTYYSFKKAGTYALPNWGSVRMLGLLSLLQHRNELTAIAIADTTSMKGKLLTLANAYVNYQKNTSPYKIVMGQGNDFDWGSNSFAANQGMLLLNAYLLTQNIDYLNATISQVDYLVGRNATGFSFVTGVGSKPVMNIHHRQSEADGIVDPVPGWLSGGPSGYSGDGCPNNTTFLAKSFTDDQKCYTKNEVAINWNAPAAYITGGLEFFGVFNIVSGIENSNVSEGSNLSVYPVPAQDEINIKCDFKSSSNINLRVIDIMGRSIRSEILPSIYNDKYITYSVADLKEGIYTIEIQNEQKIMKSKIVIKRN